MIGLRKPARQRAFTVLEFTLAMVLTLAVLLSSSLAIEHAMRALKNGTARDGAAELAYQVLAKERVFGCGLGVGAGDIAPGSFAESTITARCTTLFATLGTVPAASTDPAVRCPGDVTDPKSANYQPGSCFVLPSLRDPAHVQYRVYVRSIWRGGLSAGTGVPAAGCWNGSKPSGQPSVLGREVVVRYQRNGLWSRPVTPTTAASTSTDVSVVATGANMIPGGVPFVPQTTAVVAGQLASGRSEPVDLTVTVPGTPAVGTTPATPATTTVLNRWADDAGCVWFPFIPANATVTSTRLSIAPGTRFTPDTQGNLNIGKRGV